LDFIFKKPLENGPCETTLQTIPGKCLKHNCLDNT
jgi:hypothetical protein